MWPLLLGQGLLFMVLGVAAMIIPPLLGPVITILLGWLLIITSAADVILTITTPRRPGLWWSLASDALGLLVGGLLFAWPVGGVTSLSLALGCFLLLDGNFAILLALAHRRSHAAKWTWLGVNGLLDIVLAVIVLVALPQAEPWTFGLIVGADLVFAGITLVVMALDERSLSLRAQHRHKHSPAALAR